MTTPNNQSDVYKPRRGRVWIWLVTIASLTAVGAWALNISQRLSRSVGEINELRAIVRETPKDGTVGQTLARKEFSSAFLQMAFGDNPALLSQIKEALGSAVGGDPTLAHGDIALMLVTYRAEGELRDVSVQVFGNLNPGFMPKFSTDGYWRGQLNDQFYSMGQSTLSLLGREVMILASKDVEKRQRDLFEAGLNGQFPVVQDYLHDPVSFIAVLPDPGKLFTDEFRNYIAAVLIKGKISTDSARAELVALSYDAQKARDLAQMLSDMRMMALGLARLRSGSYKASEVGFDSLAKMKVRADGPTVVADAVFPKDFLDKALPALTKGLSRGTHRIRRGPGYPQ